MKELQAQLSTGNTLYAILLVLTQTTAIFHRTLLSIEI